MNPFLRRTLFFLFFLSGGCSLVYQVVWTRLAFASFGIITPVLSVVLSVFMLGLSVGSWGGGRIAISFPKKFGVSAVYLYAGIELCIGLGAFVVPKLFTLGQHLLLSSGETNSFRYLFLSAVVLAVSILPWCVCMGATFPFMMAFIRERGHHLQSFSFLYVANVLGAMAGVFLSAVFWIEMYGFHHTLWIAAAGNFSAAFLSVCLALNKDRQTAPENETTVPENPAPSTSRLVPAILFLTGFVAMAMEVVWTRAFAPTLKTQVYSFAAVVFVYLGATCFGSSLYRRRLRSSRSASLESLIFFLLVTAFLPILVNDPRPLVQKFWIANSDARSALIILGSICPFCALLGYLTPRLIDDISGGHPARAGKAYAVNVVGCILGPLFACYLLLPFFSERQSLILLTLPFIILWLALAKKDMVSVPKKALIAAPIIIVGLLLTHDFGTTFVKADPKTQIRRDYAASVISYKGVNSWLIVNGIAMTSLTPITKFMADLPLAYHHTPPQSALVICFGMGTSYRSALNWDIDTTVVELIPSVPKAFAFYHADAQHYLNDPRGHIIIDDGRRYLSRCGKKFDVILIDPPPPIQTAGSSLLYSKEFDALALEHLNPGGILQVWLPEGDAVTGQAITRSLCETFPYARCFLSAEGWGTHFLASTAPIDSLTPAEFVGRMPENARKDLMEWTPTISITNFVGQVLSNELSIAKLLNPNRDLQLTDDQPYNEYFLLRRWFGYSKDNQAP